MDKKESIFISAVLYISDDSKDVVEFIFNLISSLEFYFEHYEVIVVDDCCKKQDTIIKDLLFKNNTNMITIIHMSVKQGLETCLKAGLDVSIGDFVFEFDTLEFDFHKELLWDVYRKALEGNDIVSVEPKCNSFSRRLFYYIFNHYSRADYDINASAFRLVSRRAINRVMALDISCAFRQAVYASCGLKNAKIKFEGHANSKKSRGIGLAIDCFLLYTDLPQIVCCMLGIIGVLVILLGTFGVILNAVMPSLLAQELMWIAFLLGIVSLNGCVVTLICYAKLLLKGSNSKYLIENLEKIQKE